MYKCTSIMAHRRYIKAQSKQYFWGSEVEYKEKTSLREEINSCALKLTESDTQAQNRHLRYFGENTVNFNLGDSGSNNWFLRADGEKRQQK